MLINNYNFISKQRIIYFTPKSHNSPSTRNFTVQGIVPSVKIISTVPTRGSEHVTTVMSLVLVGIWMSVQGVPATDTDCTEPAFSSRYTWEEGYEGKVGKTQLNN